MKALLEPAPSAGVEWSEANRRLLDAAAGDSAWLADVSFSGIERDNPFELYRLQPWPFFSGAAKLREAARVAVGIDRLLRSAMARFLGDDPRRIDEFYQVGSEELVTLLLAQPNGIAGAMSRGDYVETAAGFSCVELNAGSQIGGWQSQFLAGLYTGCPLIARFLADNGLRVQHRNTVRALFHHLIQDTVRSGVWHGGRFNLALVIRPNHPHQEGLHRQELYDPEFQRALATALPGASGSLRLCGYEEMALGTRGPAIGGEPIHAIFEQQASLVDRRVLRHFKGGRVSLYSGLVTRLLSDKRSLALLSEHAEASALTPRERDLVDRHLPWTRKVVTEEVTRQGQQVFLPDHLLRQRGELVLKKALSLSGRDVHIGAFRSPEQWREQVGVALAEGDWIVQERVVGRPFVFKVRAGGLAPHHVVWGFVVFGGEFGGTYLRLQPFGRPTPVNAFFGAEVSVLLETGAL